MASYTNINGVKLISTGDEAGTWGTSTNTNLQILDAAAKGFIKITMTDADYTLPLDNNPSSVENGHYAGIEFFGSNSAERTITLEQNDHALVYMFLNNSGDVLRIKQGDGTGGGAANAGTITIADGDSAIVFADGAGTNAKVVDITAVMQVEAATKLTTSRDFSITGDITAAAVSFDGTGNVALSSSITAGSIVDADINASAAIADTKLATISTASKVSNSATTATDANTASAIVARDASGDFSAGTITASLTGNVTGNVTGDLTGDVTGDVTGNVTGSSGSTTGNAATATALQTARNIAGQSFDGTANISIGPTDLTGVTATASEINILDGVTATTTEINYVDGVTSSIQTQLNAKAALSGANFTGAVDVDAAMTANSFAIDNGSNDWTFEVSSNKLIIKYAGTAKMELDTSGNLKVTGDVTAFGTIS